MVWSVSGRVEQDGSLYVLIGGNDKEDAGVNDLRPSVVEFIMVSAFLGW
jgi:hypothetical protein